MKKFLILAMVLFSAIALIGESKQSLEAAEVESSWTLVTGALDVEVALLSFSYESNVNSISIDVPPSMYHTLNITGVKAQLLFYDSSDILIAAYDYNSILGDELGIFIDIDLNVLGVGNSVSMGLQIPQTYSVKPAGYNDYLDDNTTINTYIDDPDYRTTYFVYDTSGSPYSQHIESGDIAVDYGTEVITLDTSAFEYQLYNVGGASSMLYLKDEDGLLLDSLAFADYLGTTVKRIDFDLPDDDPAYTLEDIKYFSVRLYIRYSASYSTIDAANRGFIYYFNNNALTVNYIDDDGSIHSQSFGRLGLVPPYPDNPADASGHIFLHLITSEGGIYEGTAINDSMITGDTVNFYAVYSDGYVNLDDIFDYIPPTVDGPTTNPVLMFMYDLGFRDVASRVFIFVVFMLGLSVFALRFGLPVPAVMIIDGLITGYFMFLGVLPLFVSSIIITLIAFLVYSSLKGGAVRE